MSHITRIMTPTAYSPRVLLLHSIMGVGSNFFPLRDDQLPKLRSLVTDFEYRQIEAFPTILRLVNAGPLIRELSTMDKEALNRISKVSNGVRHHTYVHICK
jgi:hypothetical protein